MNTLPDQSIVYGMPLSQLYKDALASDVFNYHGPVLYASSFMDRATTLINQGRPEEAKQAINCAKWVLLTFVLGDDE